VEARGEVADRPSAMSLADHRGCTCRAFACFSKRCCPPLLPRGSVMRPLFRVLPVLPLPSLPFAVWMPTLDATVVFPSFSTPPSAPHPMSIRLAEASGGGAPQPPPLSQPLSPLPLSCTFVPGFFLRRAPLTLPVFTPPIDPTAQQQCETDPSVSLPSTLLHGSSPRR